MLPEVPFHIAQSGAGRRETFSSGDDRITYLRLLGDNLSDAEVSLLAWCYSRSLPPGGERRNSTPHDLLTTQSQWRATEFGTRTMCRAR